MHAAMTQTSAKVDLHPVADRTLPEQYRPENVLPVAEGLANGLRDPSFQELVCRIDTGPLHVADKAEPFLNGQAAFASIHDAINAAQKKVLLETYILRDDATGIEVREALRRAVVHGVTVCVLNEQLGDLRYHVLSTKWIWNANCAFRVILPLTIYDEAIVMSSGRKLYVRRPNTPIAFVHGNWLFLPAGKIADEQHIGGGVC